jgi:hypothetical protein
MSKKSEGCSIEICEEVTKKLYGSSRRINEILDSMPSRPRISCHDCSITVPEINGTTRAVLRDSSPLEIIICCNQVKESKIEEVIVHELVHAYDYSKNRCEFSSCLGLAFSEVRAAREAECHAGFFPFEFMRRKCIRDHAIRSTANLFPNSAAILCVDTVLTEAIKDIEPSPSPSVFPSH